MRRLLTILLTCSLMPAVCNAGRTAEIDGVNYTIIRGLRRTDFNLRMQASDYDPADKPAVYVLLNYQSKKTHYRVRIDSEGSRLFRVEGGMAMPIGYGTDEGLPSSGKAEIVIKRRESLLCVVVDRRIVAKAYDSFFRRGNIGCGVEGGVRISELVRQPYARVRFETDFMKSTREAKSFTDVSGTWKINSLKNPSLSANAFTFVGKGSASRPAACVTGGWSWDDYSFSVSARHTGGRVGIYFYYCDDRNYYLFRWGARGGEHGRKELIKCRNGEQTVVATDPGGYITGQWYSLCAEIQGGGAVVLIDDHEVLRHADRDLVFGKVGLYTEEPTGTVFDDARVLGKRYLDDDFSGEPILWQQLGGNWRITGEGASRGYAVKADRPGKVVAGETRWTDYTVGVDLTPPKKGAAGLCLHYLDEVNYYWARLESDGVLKLGRILEGETELLSEANVPDDVKSKPVVRLKASYLEGIIRIAVNDRTLVEVWDEAIPQGKVGLMADAAQVKFDNARVHFPERKKSVLTYNEVFEKERSMEAWAKAQSDWLPSRALGLDAGDSFTSWHRGDFFGDVDLDAHLGEVEKEAWRCSLIISADGPQPDRGYRLDVMKESPPVLSLRRNGEEIAARRLDGNQPLERMKLSRRGRFVFGYVDDELMLHYHDASPPKGSMIAVREEGRSFICDKTEVYCPNVSSFTFTQAPCDWRVSGGEWAVTSRWSCDPRWSWFYGGSESGVAANWHKRSFAGDVTLEYCAAIKMGSSLNTGYKNSRDINATICADGRDLTTGYGFLLGGFGNKKSCITRNGEVVASTKSVRLPASASQHRQWWYIKIQKKGPNLKFYVDNREILEYTDPEPLTGDRVALWTYKDALMVARVRVSAEDTSQTEPPDFDPPTLSECIYDKK